MIRLLTIIWLVSATAVLAQTPAYEFEARVHGGFLWAHRGSMIHLVKGHIKGLELSIHKNTFGNKPWEYYFNYPKPGISFIALDLSNPSELGYAIGIFPHVHFPVVKNQRINWGFEVGYGLGYLTKRFDRIENHKNIAIGSGLNGAVQLGTNMEVTITPSWLLDFGISLSHFSNASSKTPNLGINIPTISFASSFGFGKTATQSKPDSLPPLDKAFKLSFNGAFSFKQVIPTGGQTYFVYTFTTLMEKRMTPKSQLALGLDLMLDPSNREKLMRTGDTLKNDLQVWKLGIAPGYELVLGRVTMVGQFGVYLRTLYKGDGLFYHRVGSRIQLTKHLRMNLLLKSHFAVADYFEWGLGYIL